MGLPAATHLIVEGRTLKGRPRLTQVNEVSRDVRKHCKLVVRYRAALAYLTGGRVMNTYLKTACLGLALAFATPSGVMAGDPAPMPETRGMQGMDPALHEQWAKEGKQDPYKDCTPNADKAAHQAQHPMPDTRGMHHMDPKAHTMDCPGAKAPDPNAPPKHVHKAN